MPGDERALGRYVDELIRWNAKMKLTGCTRGREVRDALLDPLRELLPALGRHSWECAVDVGSGNGIVAVPLALAFPERRVVTLDSDRRKCVFLKHVAYTLPLPNLSVAHGRLEDYAPPAEGPKLLWTLRAIEIGEDVLRRALFTRPGALVAAFGLRASPLVRFVLDAGSARSGTHEMETVSSAARPDFVCALLRVGAPPAG